MEKTPLLGLSELDLARAIAPVAAEAFRARQVMSWIYDKRASGFSEMSDLPRPLRERLAESFELGLPRIAARTPAEDGAEKFLFEMADGAPTGEREMEQVIAAGTRAALERMAARIVAAAGEAARSASS